MLLDVQLPPAAQNSQIFMPFCMTGGLKMDSYAENSTYYLEDHVNGNWQGAITGGHPVGVKGSAVKARLFAVMDAASRRVLGAKYFFDNSHAVVRETLKGALLAYGIPEVLALGCDPACEGEDIDQICESLHIEIIHCSMVKSKADAKIKRFFRTINDLWLCTVPSFADLDSINAGLAKFLEAYNNRVHSTLNMTPLERWSLDSGLIINAEPEALKQAFSICG
jgi:hypothetical protein